MAAAAQPVAALLVPGRPLRTDFTVVTPKNMVIDVPVPAQVREVGVSLLQPAAVPPQHALALYYALPPYAEWEYVGALDASCPSGVFRAPWAGRIRPDVPAVRLGLSLETHDFVAQQVPADAREAQRATDAAVGIAKSLFDHMQSFARNDGRYRELLGDLGKSVLILPADTIDKWFEKFSTRHRLEPYFFLKRSGGLELKR